MTNFFETDIMYIDEFIKRMEDKNNFGAALYSPVWNIDDFCTNNTIDHEKVNQINNEIITFIAILSNTIEQITDYALDVGINKETIVAKIDRSRRNEKIFENKIKEFYQMNKRDNKSVEELKQFAEELGLGGNQIKLALSKARW